MPNVALTIAGSDPSGGAGIQADLKTFHQFGVYGSAVLTLLTVQNTQSVTRVELMDPKLVSEQLRAVLDDIPPAAVKTGALGSAGIIRAVAAELRGSNFPLVIDPVMVSKHGAPLIDSDAVSALVKHLFPRARLVTPNIPEAEALISGVIQSPEDMERAARLIQEMGPEAVLVKGGHLDGEALDLLLEAGRIYRYPARRIETRHTHGTGCTYSAAITACLANGLNIADAVKTAKAFVTEAIRTAPGLGQGYGPVNHLAPVLA